MYKTIVIYIISGVRRRARAIIPHDSTALLNQLRVEEIQKEREARKQQMMERKAVLESHIQGMMEWEDKLMEGHREEVKAMWEVRFFYVKGHGCNTCKSKCLRFRYQITKDMSVCNSSLSKQ